MPKPNADTKGEEDDKGIGDIVSMPVKVAVAKSGPISSYLEFDSILETESAVEVHSESSGLVVAVMAKWAILLKRDMSSRSSKMRNKKSMCDSRFPATSTFSRNSSIPRICSNETSSISKNTIRKSSIRRRSRRS